MVNKTLIPSQSFLSGCDALGRTWGSLSLRALLKGINKEKKLVTLTQRFDMNNCQPGIIPMRYKRETLALQMQLLGEQISPLEFREQMEENDDLKSRSLEESPVEFGARAPQGTLAAWCWHIRN